MLVQARAFHYLRGPAGFQIKKHGGAEDDLGVAALCLVQSPGQFQNLDRPAEGGLVLARFLFQGGQKPVGQSLVPGLVLLEPFLGIVAQTLLGVFAPLGAAQV